MKHLILIDGNSILFRAYYATAYPGATLMQTSKGEYTNALFAFVNMFTKIVENNEQHVLVAFDTSEPTFRHKSYDDYKAGRKAMPEELGEQIPLVHKYIELLGVKPYFKAGYEADDIIGIYAKEASNKGIKVDIYSSDKDLLQLVDDNITVNLLKSGMKEVNSYTPKSLFEEYELTHEQMIDLKALMGDTSDNIPGVPGVGQKTATRLLKEYHTLENIYKNIDNLKGKLKENLENNKELALMSKDLVTILVEGDLDFTLDELKRDDYDKSELISFFQNYELHSLVKQLDTEPIEQEDFDVINIETEEELKAILNKKASIHFEFSDENYHKANLWGIGYYANKKAYFINPQLIHTDTFKTYVRNNDNELLTYDLKAIKVYLLWQGINITNLKFDLLLAAYLIDSHYGKEEFKYIVSKFDYDQVEYDDIIYGRGAKKGLPEDKEIYKRHIASKAKAIFKLEDQLTENLKEVNQYNLYKDIELPLASVLAKMEYSGLLVDLVELDNQGKNLDERINSLVEEIIKLAGKDFNVNSPKQLGEVLFDDLKLPHAKKTKTGYSTNADILNKLVDVHPIIPLILNFRELNKLYTTYIQGLKQAVFADSKVHTIYKQALTTTGRLSSVEPNLQNIPTRTVEGRQIRKIFTASEDCYLLSADYSQIELRILADIANVKGLIEAFDNNEDIHTDTAKKVYNKMEVDADERRSAKAVNFGIIYGMQAWSLSEDLNVSVKEAEEFINKYLEIYPEINVYMNDIVKFAEENGYVETLLNRRRYIPELKSRVFFQKEFGKRTALNAPIQGTAADIIKIAMIELDKYLEKHNKESKLLLQVHDELILEVPSHELDEMRDLVPKLMNKAYKLKVDLKTSVETGKTWFEV